MLHEFDQRDQELLKELRASWNREELKANPRVGDFIIWPDGHHERVSHAWAADWHDDGIATYQTSPGGSWHLGFGWGKQAGVSFSGSLYAGIPQTKLREKEGCSRFGDFWIWHHGVPGAARGVHVSVPCRIYELTADSHLYGRNGRWS